MNKFDEFHNLRRELAAEYEKELRGIHHLLEKGVHVIGGHQDFLSVHDSGNFVSRGRARTLFKAAVTKGLESILQQYLLDLTREAVQLGLHASIDGSETATGVPAPAQKPVANNSNKLEGEKLGLVEGTGRGGDVRKEATAIDPALIRNIVEATRKGVPYEGVDGTGANDADEDAANLVAVEGGWVAHGRR